jgi:hypothetical protein
MDSETYGMLLCFLIGLGIGTLIGVFLMRPWRREDKDEYTTITVTPNEIYQLKGCVSLDEERFQIVSIKRTNSVEKAVVELVLKKITQQDLIRDAFLKEPFLKKGGRNPGPPPDAKQPPDPPPQKPCKPLIIKIGGEEIDFH